MAVLGTILRWRRGESLVFAALLFACLMLPAVAPGAVLPPQNAHAVLLWLSSELAPDAATSPLSKRENQLLSLQQRDNAPLYQSFVAAPPIMSAPANARLAKLQIEARPLPISTLESHEAAFIAGVRSNRRRN